MSSTSTSGISRRKGQFCAKGQVPNLQILFAWPLTRPFLKTTQLGCPTSTVPNPRSTRAAVPQQRCHDAQAPLAQAPYTTPRAAGGRARSTEGPLPNPAHRESPPWSGFVDADVTSAKLFPPPSARPPDAAVTWGNGPALACPLGTSRSGPSFPRGPVKESEWTWPRPRPGEEFPGHLAGGWQNRGRKQPSGRVS